ncbi:hypothetical protein ACTQ54_03640 [Fundicoccus sp. Sow4_H7]|uniref:hypothetical protein n=1 Tax=Fundicoccus sp. Sow4_H7 TaxID=3438784 RepID=UPI003F93EEAA
MAEPFRKASSNYYVQSEQSEDIYWEANLQVEPTDTYEHIPNSNQDADRYAATSHSFLSLFDKLIIGIVFLICFVCLCLNLVIQYQTEPMIDASLEYQNHTAEVQLETKIIVNEIAEQYDYDIIKQVAEKEGMQLEKSRVRNVGE